jgi:Holliday junction resolvase-like predicted endonuclease
MPNSSAAAAESYVADALEERGWRVVARNLRTPWGELDILGVDPDEVLVVVEVKARHPLSWARGEEALRPRQRRRLARAIEGVALRRGWPGALRVDLAEVDLLGGRPADWRLLRGVDLCGE